MRFRAKVDSNHVKIVSFLRQMGCSVLSLAGHGKGVPDILAARCGRMALVEIKDGSRPPSQRKLTQDQIEFRHRWNSEIYIVTNEQEAMDLVNNCL